VQNRWLSEKQQIPISFYSCGTRTHHTRANTLTITPPIWLKCKNESWKLFIKVYDFSEGMPYLILIFIFHFLLIALRCWILLVYNNGKRFNYLVIEIKSKLHWSRTKYCKRKKSFVERKFLCNILDGLSTNFIDGHMR
jgi:hypothetical protein